MLRRAGLLAGALLLFSVTGCVLANLVALPFELLFQVLGLMGEGVSALGGAVASVEVEEGPAPVLVRTGPGEFRLTGIDPAARFRVVCSAPGRVDRVYRWPEDLRDVEGPVVCVLPPEASAQMEASAK